MDYNPNCGIFGLPDCPPEPFLKAPPGKKTPAEIQDEMVQDPVCKTYVPKRVALEGNRSDGQKEYFCSAECRDNYLKKRTTGTEK